MSQFNKYIPLTDYPNLLRELIKAEASAEKYPLKLRLKAENNPDYSQHGDLIEGGMETPEMIVGCESIEEARDIVWNFIAIFQLGGGNFAGGELTLNGEHIGYISYNKRAWKGKPEDWEANEEFTEKERRRKYRPQK